MKNIKYTKILAVLILLSFGSVKAQTPVTLNWLNETKSIVLSLNWKYSSYDSNYAYVDDSLSNAWTSIPSTLFNSENELIYSGNKVWLYKEFKIDSSLYNKTIGIDILFLADIKIYLNNELIFDRKFNDGKPVLPVHKTFSADSIQYLKVELSTDDLKYFISKNLTYGFEIYLVKYDEFLRSRISMLSKLSTQRNIFVVITLVLALFHFFLFLFNKKKLNNFFYVLFLLFFSLFLAGNYNSYFSGNAGLFIHYIGAFKGILTFVILCGSTAIYTIYKPLPKYYIFFWIYSSALAVLGYLFSSIIFLYLTYITVTAFSVWGSWYLFGPQKDRSFGEKIIKTGFIVMALSGILQMLYSLNFIQEILGFGDVYVYGVIFFMFAMSLAFAYDFASTSKNLERKLKEVQELSEKTIEQERLVREQELERKLLEADNNRKTKELEEARKLQLSMLPVCLNDIPGLDICFDMKTATEVGGDYYDYYISNDGTLNIAIGDATGHGTKAGLMVATIKSLFNALGAKMMIPDFFNRCTEIIKTMNLGNLFMSMTIIRYKNKRLIVSAAGMPPILIYKKSADRIDEILIKGMPLGGFRDFKYYEEEYDLESGDVILMMTDGLPELFNENKEMFGDIKIRELLELHHVKTATEINRELFKAADLWRGKKPLDDDMTFITMKIK